MNKLCSGCKRLCLY